MGHLQSERNRSRIQPQGSEFHRSLILECSGEKTMMYIWGKTVLYIWETPHTLASVFPGTVKALSSALEKKLTWFNPIICDVFF